MRFTAELQSNGRTATGFVVPDEVVEADPAAAAYFGSLSYSQQRLFAEPVTAARTDETRRRRVDKAMTALREGRKRP